MANMEVIGVKLTDDPTSNKIAYRKRGKVYVRSGADGYKVGSPLQGASDHLFSKFGYRRVDNAPQFRDGAEMAENAHRFELGRGGKATYSI